MELEETMMLESESS